MAILLTFLLKPKTRSHPCFFPLSSMSTSNHPPRPINQHLSVASMPLHPQLLPPLGCRASYLMASLASLRCSQMIFLKHTCDCYSAASNPSFDCHCHCDKVQKHQQGFWGSSETHLCLLQPPVSSCSVSLSLHCMLPWAFAQSLLNAQAPIGLTNCHLSSGLSWINTSFGSASLTYPYSA